VEQTGVVIVGAGLAGLSTAVFLGLHGVPATVLERHPGTSVQPKARGQAPVVMEAFATADLTAPIRKAEPAGQSGLTVKISRSMAGPVLHDFDPEVHGMGAFSPAEGGSASQARAERALAERASELGAVLRFRTRCEELTQDADGVTLGVRDLESDTVEEIRAAYVVAADGHRGGLREAVGIGGHGRGTFDASDSVRFAADLSAVAGADAVVLHYVQNPDLPGGAGVLVSTDEPDEWVAAMAADPERDDAATEALIRTMVGVPDLTLQILGRDTWESAHRVADRFREGRVLLVGDAAHVCPPTGGQGGNTAMLDGYHLGWRLAAVVRGEAGPGLLDSHDAERRPYAEAVCDWQVANLVVRQRPDLADASIGEPMDGMTLLFGYVCGGGAVVAEPGAPDELFEDPRTPSGRPGSRVPHVALRGPDGPVSPRELIGPHWLVLTGSADGVRAAQVAAGELGVAVRAYRVGEDLHDTDGAWDRVSGAGPQGTVLVRPDGVVAWRGADAAGLTTALRTVLHR
jgi:putative polyketide hydroxylase